MNTLKSMFGYGNTETLNNNKGSITNASITNSSITNDDVIKNNNITTDVASNTKSTIQSATKSKSACCFVSVILAPFKLIAAIVRALFCCSSNAKLTEAEVKILKDFKSKDGNDLLAAYQGLSRSANIQKVILETAKDSLAGEVKKNKITQEKANAEFKTLEGSFTDRALTDKDVPMHFINMAIAKYEKANLLKK